MKKEWVKPEIKFITDPDIILGCLYEVYGQEQKSVLAGKNIRHTMIFPFLRMLANNTQGDVRDLEALHQRLWKIYEKRTGKAGVCTAGRENPGSCQERRRRRMISYGKSKKWGSS